MYLPCIQHEQFDRMGAGYPNFKLSHGQPRRMGLCASFVEDWRHTWPQLEPTIWKDKQGLLNAINSRTQPKAVVA